MTSPAMSRPALLNLESLPPTSALKNRTPNPYPLTLARTLGVGRLPTAGGARLLGLALPTRRLRWLLRDALHLVSPSPSPSPSPNSHPNPHPTLTLPLPQILILVLILILILILILPQTRKDKNEPSVFDGPEITMPPTLLHHDAEGRAYEHRELHNMYGLLMSMGTMDGQKKACPARLTPDP
jgi:hypothetical protein